MIPKIQNIKNFFFKEFEEDENNDNIGNPDIIVISDVHLGASGCEYIALQRFLHSILNKKYGNNLQALIIIGDFFDLCLSDIDLIKTNKDYWSLFDSLLHILESDIHVYLALGNHEIPVDDANNDDIAFERERNIFIQKLENSDHYVFKTMIDRDLATIDQYIVVTNSSIENFNIQGYSNLDEFKRKIDNNPLNILLCHGHQFQKKGLRKNIGKIFWTPLINEDFWKKRLIEFLHIKKNKIQKFIDLIWNKILHKCKSDRDIKRLLKKFYLSHKEARKLKYLINKERITNEFYKFIRKVQFESRFIENISLKVDSEKILEDLQKNITNSDLLSNLNQNEKQIIENCINHSIINKKNLKILSIAHKCYKEWKMELKRRTNKHNKKYNTRILKFIDKNELENKIFNIIYGHTHKWQTNKSTNGRAELITNTGAWQKVNFPNYVVIYNIRRKE